MQMPVTQFEADSYEPTINQFDDLMTLPASSSETLRPGPVDCPDERVSPSKALQRDAEKRRKRETIIGANCLSIIGLIEPGRTVRLYRQIH